MDRHQISGLITAAMISFGSNPAVAATDIAPPWVYLSAGSTSGTISITNDRNVSAGYVISAFSWVGIRDGKPVMKPEHDIQVTPTSLSLSPHAKGEVTVRVNVGSSTADETEKTYRIVVRELPNRQRDGNDAVNVIATVSLPVFLQPPMPKISGELKEKTIKPGKIHINLKNSGNTHLFAKNITLVGNDAEGRETFRLERNGWYVLAGQRQNFYAIISSADCLKSSVIVAKAYLLDSSLQQDGDVLESTLKPQGKGCGRATRSEFQFSTSGGKAMAVPTLRPQGIDRTP